MDDNGPEIIDIGAIDWTDVTSNRPGQVGAGEPAVRYKAFRLDSAVVPAGQKAEAIEIPSFWCRKLAYHTAWADQYA